jgi:hypothetical protein
MIDVDLRTTLREQHRRELLAEAETQRLIHALPRHQRRLGVLARAIHAGWALLLHRRVKGTAASSAGGQKGMRMLVRYYPANDFDPNRSN